MKTDLFDVNCTATISAIATTTSNCDRADETSALGAEALKAGNLNNNTSYSSTPTDQSKKVSCFSSENSFTDYEQLLEDVCPDEIYRLQKELDSLLSAIDAAERMYAMGNPEYQEIRLVALLGVVKVKASVRSLAIGMGIHREFLAEYQERVNRTAT